MGFKVFDFGLGDFSLIFIFSFYTWNVDQRTRLQERKLFRALSFTYLAGKIIYYLLYKLLVISVISAMEIIMVFYHPWVCVKTINVTVNIHAITSPTLNFLDFKVKTNYEQRGQWGPAEVFNSSIPKYQRN